jgi:glycosyltransferase involved in cell wall biosynthesis
MEILDLYPKTAKILFIGPYPPPLGGVSVHLKRLINILRRDKYQVKIFNTAGDYGSRIRKIISLFREIYFNDYDIVHTHVLSNRIAFLLLFLKSLKNFEIFLTDHNPRFFNDQPTFTQFFLKIFIRNLGCLVLVGEHISESYKRNSIRLPDQVIVKNAFLPPPLEEENVIMRTYSDETKDFIKNRKPLILSNAYQITLDQGFDVYGLDLCVGLVSRLKDHFPNVGLLFALANELANKEYLGLIERRIRELNIQISFHFMTGQKELWPLFKMADLIVRPTLTDGDAISVREALFFNCPVIASNVVKRPKGTICFKSRDIDDLYRLTYQLLLAEDMHLK